ncbi:16S rRNA (guanine(527)-N(7))-methyltransferase RsmG [Sphingomonas sp. BGYR3]|uniref:16S rRNA (guanine(527)-N(7))-methyltransferase RsmG n=1 Tax=Sphingomonas sp. BGYR3 TaxID=2975483 RepID=UPI0021A87BE8|nr:16S rRNA (guanine(527)-N(7))-methyltransferase RsmG [Sphingomonas sp. BGYR3]MDG5488645.1 16S rRNA (guanine(527)-N(7))-methyltransferase RsmG [Sphingomonas sp. BGYR3]
MDEAQARQWLSDRFGVSRETMLSRFVEMLRDEAGRQNLIARSTLDQLWHRHIVDSAQLLDHASGVDGLWIDIGTGAGLPGMVIAILRDGPIRMVEPRRRRVEFLNQVVDSLGLNNAEVVLGRIETAPRTSPAAIISARAVAGLPELFAGAQGHADQSTLWVLPKGQSAQSEVAAARGTWQGVFHVEPSITDPQSGIVIANKVRPR